MRKLIVVAVLLVIGLLGFFAAARVFKGYSPTQAVRFPLAPNPSELCKIGDPIVIALRKYYEDIGRYPASLADAQIAATPTFFGPWTYQCLDDGRSCVLSNGDYGRYLFVVSWTPKGEWYIDT